ncbi:DUF3530 family protein [Cognaticolwellia beringensis]|uniref:DUF3530 domain-containing protein n=1 Tax=Cognaticolwellia beringensis TaxID=1967665 RepID=A0A222G379_9GAMM|nr:DUF3530 family protein [Cognaticolwellia beringensis]ASP46396.1 DUF3530 domain-containing protein [Cognaticolwellia beringensis]
MRLKIKPLFSFIILATSILLVNSSQSLAFDPFQEVQEPLKTVEKTENTTKKGSEATKSTEPEVEVENTEVESIKGTEAEDEHQHHVIINPPVNSFEQQQQDIKHYLSQEKISSIVVDSENYLTAVNAHTTAINKGTLLLIPDWQQSIATPNALNQLRKNMPQHGWTTITLHPPSKPENYPSQALMVQERSTEDIETLTSYGKKLADIMLALIEKAKSYPGVIIVVAEGNHSAVLLDIYQQALVGAPAAFVMLSSYMPTIPASDKIAQQLAATDYPILDLYLKRDHRLVIANANIRKNAAKRALKVYYRQKQLSNQVTGYYPKNTLTTEIISWLSTIGW